MPAPGAPARNVEADREALKLAIKAFGDPSGLAEIYAELYAPGVGDTDLLPAGERAGGDRELEELLLELSGRGSDFASIPTQREAVAESKLKQRYGLDLKTFEQRIAEFTAAYAQAALNVGSDILTRAEAVCVMYLETVKELLPAAREMVDALGPARAVQLARLQEADELLLNAGMPGVDPRASDAMRELGKEKRAQTLAQVKALLEDHGFVEWADFDAEGWLRRAANPYVLMRFAHEYFQKHLIAVGEAQAQLDLESVWGLDLLLREAEKQLEIPQGISEKDPSFFRRIIMTQQRRSRSTRSSRIEALLSWSLTLLGLVVPGSALATRVAMAGMGAAAAAYTASDSVWSYQKQKPLITTGLKSEDPTALLRAILSVIGATVAAFGAGRRFSDWLARRKVALRPVMPREPVRQLTAGTSRKQVAHEVFSLGKYGALLTGKRSLTEDGVLCVELEYLNAPNAVHLETLTHEMLAEVELLERASKMRVRAISITVAPGKHGPAFGRTSELRPENVIDAPLRGYHPAGRYNAAVVFQLLDDAFKSGVASWTEVNIFANGQFAARLFGPAARVQGELHVEVTGFLAVKAAKIWDLAKGFVLKYGDVSRVRFTGTYRWLPLVNRRFDILANPNPKDIAAALSEIAKLRGVIPR